jgi:hypothetical protein
MHFATFAGIDVEAFDPIVALEEAKREMARGTGGQVIDAETGRVGGKEGEPEPPPPGEVRETEGPVIVSNWWIEGGMGVIDVGETAVVSVGENPQGIRRDKFTPVAG